jgi:hypothetical protein
MAEGARIQDLIDRLDLKPIREEFLPYEAQVVPFVGHFEDQAHERIILRKIPFPGGLKIAHLHHGEHIYQLNETQWSEFSQAVVKGFQEKLSAAKSVNIEKLTALSEAIEGL